MLSLLEMFFCILLVLYITVALRNLLQCKSCESYTLPDFVDELEGGQVVHEVFAKYSILDVWRGSNYTSEVVADDLQLN